VAALTMMALLGSAVGDPQASSYPVRAHEIAIANGDARMVRRARLALFDSVAAGDDLGPLRGLLEGVYDECSEEMTN
jgi:hypothetical protein